MIDCAAINDRLWNKGIRIPLSDPRREAFCQRVCQGLSKRTAYNLAGYRPRMAFEGGSTWHRMFHKPEIQRRIRAILGEMMDRGEVTKEYVIEGLKQLAETAKKESVKLG